MKVFPLFLFPFFYYLIGCTLKPQNPFEKSLTFESKIASFSLVMSQDNYDNFIKSTYYDEYHSTYLKWDSQQYEAKIKFHGNSGRKYNRKSYTIKFYEKNELIGNYILSSSVGDNSVCKYTLANNVFRKSGLLCPDEEMVDFYINGQYVGLYRLIENIDEIFFRKRNVPIASLYKSLYVPNAFNNQILPSAHFQKKYPEDAVYLDIEKLFSIIEKGITLENLSDLGEILNIENCLTYYAMSSATANFDGIDKNFYLYFNRVNNKLEFLPWDLDRTFDNHLINTNTIIYFNNNLISQLILLPGIKSNMTQKIKNFYNPLEVSENLSTLVAEIEPSYYNDPYFLNESFDLNQKVADIFLFNNKMSTLLSNL